MISRFTNTRAIIFDMDGVLFHSNASHEQAFRETLDAHGIDAANFSYASIAGMRTDEAFDHIFKAHRTIVSSKTLSALVAEKRRRALATLATTATITPGSAALIAKLRQRYRLMLASSASRKTIDLFLATCGYADAFQCTLDGSSVARAKPAPDIYLLALEQLELSGDDCVVVEDSEAGITAAVQAGIPAIAISTTNANRLLQIGASEVVPSLDQVMQLLSVGVPA